MEDIGVKRRTAGRLLTLAAGAVFLAGPAGCAPPADSVRLAGSSSMEKLSGALAESFMEQYPGVTITVQFTGSSAGIEAVEEGRADIGNASRRLTKEEKAGGLTEHIVALDGIAVCTDPANKVTGLTGQQLKDLYTGRITNWLELGGEDIPVVVVGREAGSGTREAFEGLLGITGECTYANVLDSTGAVAARVASTPGAVGYVSFDVLGGKGQAGEEAGLRALSLDGAQPTGDNVKAGIYPLCRPFIMVTKGKLSEQKAPVQKWFRYVYSSEGQKIAEKAGLIVISNIEEGAESSQ